MEISKQARLELVKSVSERYRSGTRHEKTQILNEFARITGYHRKHAIRLLTQPDLAKKSSSAPRIRNTYDEAVRQALVILWEASDRICGKRLRQLIPLLIDSLTNHGHLSLDQEVKSKLLKISAASIDRLLVPARSTSKQRCRKKSSGMRSQIPIRTFADWNDPQPGFLEIDLVAHCGGNASGRYNHTLTLTDISSGWTECVALAVRDSSLVVEGIEKVRRSLPFKMLGIDSDNGSEFINGPVLKFCRDFGIEQTRSRPYKKNDQAWVEQKNGSVVRRLTGYGRFAGLEGAESLARLYGSSRLFVNFFQPSFKLIEKVRIGAKVRKKYDKPTTPCARLLASDHISGEQKVRLRDVQESLDPLQLLDEIRLMQSHLSRLATGAPKLDSPPSDANLDAFLASLATAWEEGEVRPTHRKVSKKRNWRTRADPFQLVWTSCGPTKSEQ